MASEMTSEEMWMSKLVSSWGLSFASKYEGSTPWWDPLAGVIERTNIWTKIIAEINIGILRASFKSNQSFIDSAIAI